MTRYRLRKEPVAEHMKRLGQTYKSVSRYMTENTDDNWLSNRTNASRSTLVTYKEAEKLAWYLGVKVDDITDEVDDAEYRGRHPADPQEIVIVPEISEEQWEKLGAVISKAIEEVLGN